MRSIRKGARPRTRRRTLPGLGRGLPAGPPLGGALGGGLPGAGMRPPIAPPMAGPPGAGGLPGMKKGGKVKKTGPHMLHKGEHVTPAKGKKPTPRKR